MFKSLKVSLRYSSAYHPQSDRQTERVNQCLKNYLRCMAFQEPKKWASWLSLAEWWYNTNYPNSLKSTPFEALYGYSPPLITEVMVLGPKSPAVDFLAQKQSMIERLKENLTQAQTHINMYADLKRIEREFQVGDMVYLRLQPLGTNAFGIHHSMKLATRFYGPFKILERIGQVTYKLQLPVSANIHPVFHVSQLKKHLGAKVVPRSNLPLVTKEGYLKTESVEVLDTRALSRNDNIVTQWRIKWHNLSKDQATWEDKLFIKATFPDFYNRIIREWWPPAASSGEEASQGGEGSCHDHGAVPAEGE
jgi:hypothetical protein